MQIECSNSATTDALLREHHFETNRNTEYATLPIIQQEGKCCFNPYHGESKWYVSEQIKFTFTIATGRLGGRRLLRDYLQG